VHTGEKPRVIGEDCCTPDIEILGATAFDYFVVSNKIIGTFALRIGECRGLLQATMEVTTLENASEIGTINAKRWTSEQEASAVVAAEKRPQILE